MNNIRRLTGSQLKTIAMVSMFLDHFGAVVLLNLIQTSFVSQTGTVLSWAARNQLALIELYDLLRYIGRFAFPLYCFLLVEGVAHTGSPVRYGLRLGLFALLSEIPFDLSLNGALLEFSYNNVFFTLLTGFVCAAALEWWGPWLKGRELPGGLRRALFAAGVLAVAVPGFLLAEDVLLCDYGGMGVLAILAMYLLRPWPVAAYIGGVVLLSLDASIELYALAMALPVLCYNGQRGRKMKFGPYIFYPAHLLAFYAITLLWR